MHLCVWAFFITQTVKSQFTGRKHKYSKDFSMHSGQHLALEYIKVESDSDWSVTLNQQKVMINT